METGLIRFEADQQDWAARETRIKNKFGADFLKNGPYLKEKLAFLEGLEIRYGRGNSLDERLELAIHKQQRQQIEKTLYPSFFVRLAYKVMQAFVINRQQRIVQASQRINLDAVKNDLVAKGLGHAIKSFEEQARLGKQEFIIPVSYHVSENESMSFKINFKKNFDGNYQIKDTVASLKVEGQPKAGGSVKMDKADGLDLNADNAYRLLSGKSLKKNDAWINIDFNDRDSMGNCVLRSFPKDYGYNLDLLLAQVNAKELTGPVEFQKIKSLLEDGHEVKLTSVGKGEEIRIEANPRQQSLSSREQISHRQSAQPLVVPTAKQQMQNRSKMKIG